MRAWTACSAATNQFISVTLGVAGLRRLAKAVDTAFTNAHALLADHVQPCIEQLVVELGELAGLAECEEQSQPLGLRPPVARLCLTCAAEVLAAAQMAMVECRTAARSFRHVFIWLQRCQKRCGLRHDPLPAIAGAHTHAAG